MTLGKWVSWAAVSAGLLSFNACVAEPSSKAEPFSTAERSAKTISIHIEHMGCSACADGVASILKQIDGVKEAKVRAADKGAVIGYDPAKVTPQQLVDAVNAAGFTATLPAS